MTYFSLLLLGKIAGSLVLFVLPMLVLPQARLDRLLGHATSSPAMYRLYGTAVLALLVAYAWGIVMAERGEMPWGVVATGLVSNAGGLLVMIVTGMIAKARTSAIFIGCVAVGLCAVSVMPNLALQSAF